MAIPDDLQREINDLASTYSMRLKVAKKGYALDGLPADPDALTGGYYLDSRRRGDQVVEQLVRAGVDRTEADAAVDAALPYPPELPSWEACVAAAGSHPATAAMRYPGGTTLEAIRAGAGNWSTMSQPIQRQP